MQQIEIRIGNRTKIYFSLPGQLQRQVHQRLSPERSRAWIRVYFPERVRVFEVRLGRRRIEIVCFERVLEVPSELHLEALAE